MASVAELDELGERIPFGTRPNESVPPSWAAGMLTLLRERYPSIFVALMGEASTGYRAEIKRRRGENGAS